jgi:hypothetical protein
MAGVLPACQLSSLYAKENNMKIKTNVKAGNVTPAVKKK